MCLCSLLSRFFFFNDTATTEIYTLSLHDALPIWGAAAARIGKYKKAEALPQRAPGSIKSGALPQREMGSIRSRGAAAARIGKYRSEEHTSELQSLTNLVCRLLLEKKKKKTNTSIPPSNNNNSISNEELN